jgi:hypothetical protein
MRLAQIYRLEWRQNKRAIWFPGKRRQDSGRGMPNNHTVKLWQSLDAEDWHAHPERIENGSELGFAVKSGRPREDSIAHLRQEERLPARVADDGVLCIIAFDCAEGRQSNELCL